MAGGPGFIMPGSSMGMERTVIDEGLIRQAVIEDRKPVKEEGAQPTADDDDVDEGLDEDFNLIEIDSLSLSFQNIFKIDNLQGFANLTKLQLDNNVIERIENLGHLVNLTWLDLSFNNITKIENLDALINLTDLSLFHNQVNVIENLDALTKLNVLSLGNNNIKDVENIVYLRRFQDLRLLNLTGNPVCREDDYMTTVLAYLQHLHYLDYETIDSAQVVKAKEDKQAQLLELEELEKQHAQESAKAVKKQLFRDALQKANLAGVDDLFDEMIRDDAEIVRLQQLPGFKTVLQSYREKTEKTVSEFVERMLTASNADQEEFALFMGALVKLHKTNETESLERIRQFKKTQKKTLGEFTSGAKEGVPDGTLIAKLAESVQNLSDDLMDLEMQCTEEAMECINEFEGTVSRTTKANIEQMSNFFRLLEDLERVYWEDLTALVHGLIEKYNGSSASDNPIEPDTTLSTILSEKEALETSISNSHNNHLERILKFGDEVVDRATKSAERVSADARNKEYLRNRRRVSEIFDLVQQLNTQNGIATSPSVTK
ncbi:unnamed protein product (mitochondrion) [Plasmodiophora brassicae]|uniref:Dynein regulatory complex subunit 3 n=1 Tax=Plasmodiophora brassicae TaxID=37360 RepID=A0A0G4IYP9_PLABS|nr:hypothetical protein PBRA_001441 [Plasmodiophora brassicae]SPQ94103.1 unnamed protein product [Plasmodiophora brassicae]